MTSRIMAESLRNLVLQRAANRCEYCRIHQDDELYFRYHLEHITPRQHGGTTVETNLALACHHCNLHKGPNLAGIDPGTGKLTPLFNPRTQSWKEHFTRQGVNIVGITACGRTTVYVLAMNAAPRLHLRSIARLPD